MCEPSSASKRYRRRKLEETKSKIRTDSDLQECGTKRKLREEIWTIQSLLEKVQYILLTTLFVPWMRKNSTFFPSFSP